MKVVVGTKTASGRTIEVELEAADGEKIFGGWWAEQPTDVKLKRLSAYADLQVLQYLLRNQEVHQDYFNKRVKELAKDLQ